MDLKDSATRSGNNNKARTMKGYETTIKNVLDEISPDLQATRKNWAMIEDSVKQFEAGQKIFSTKTDPEQFAITFQKLVDAGNEDAIHHYETTRDSGRTTANGPSDYSHRVEVNSDFDNPILVSNREYEERIQDKNRSIVLLDKRYLRAFVSEFNALVRG